MMLGGEHDVLHTGQFRKRRCFMWRKSDGVESPWELIEVPFHIIVGSAHQRMADDDAQLGVHAEMNKEACAGVPEPFHAFRLVQVIIAGLVVPDSVVLRRNKQGWQKKKEGRELPPFTKTQLAFVYEKM